MIIWSHFYLSRWEESRRIKQAGRAQPLRNREHRRLRNSQTRRPVLLKAATFTVILLLRRREPFGRFRDRRCQSTGDELRKELAVIVVGKESWKPESWDQGWTQRRRRGSHHWKDSPWKCVVEEWRWAVVVAAPSSRTLVVALHFHPFGWRQQRLFFLTLSLFFSPLCFCLILVGSSLLLAFCYEDLKFSKSPRCRYEKALPFIFHFTI